MALYSAKRRRWRSFMLLYLLLAYYTITYVAFQVQTRFCWEIEPYLLIFAALTVDRLLNALQARRRRGLPAHPDQRGFARPPGGGCDALAMNWRM